jgi:hypothetical protein
MLGTGLVVVRRTTRVSWPSRRCTPDYRDYTTAVRGPPRLGQDLCAGWWQLIVGLGPVPRCLVWDGEGVIGRWRPGGPQLTAGCQAYPAG